jgi:enoyl-CoA hydratase
LSEKILVTDDGPVRIITINRPQVRNALDREAASALREAFEGFEADAAAQVAVLTGAGGSFCAGADLKEMAADGAVYAPWAGSNGPNSRVLSKPMIAAVAGHACAGGLGVALRCDIRIADTSAVFGVFSRRFGVPMSDGTTVLLPRVVGLGVAQDMLITGRAVEAEEALRIGLITRLVDASTVLEAAVALGKQIAALPQVALNSDRHSAYGQGGLPLSAAFAQEIALAETAKATEAHAGAARFAAGVGRHGGFG